MAPPAIVSSMGVISVLYIGTMHMLWKLQAYCITIDQYFNNNTNEWDIVRKFLNRVAMMSY